MIKLTDVSKNYGDKKVLNGVSLTIEEGTIYGLIGKNGAGKTTLMSIMAGLLPYEGGSVELIKEDGRNAKVGYLPDLPAFFEYMTSSEYLDFLLMEDNKEVRDELLTMVGLEGNVRIKGMSRGMRQRLGIAAALVGDPDIILLDEPTSALDPQGRIEVMDILKKLRSQGKSVLLSTHILADMEKVCDRVGFLSEGVLIRQMNISELNGSMSSIYLTFASTPDETFFDGMNNISCTKVEDLVLRMDATGGNIIGAQKELFARLSTYDNPVTGFKLNMSDLDTLFQEVCL